MAKNNIELIENLYKDYSEYIFKFCLSRLKDKELAMDCMQEVFRIALEKLITVNEKIVEPKAWLTAIAFYTIKSFLKKRTIMYKRIVPIDELVSEVVDISYDEDLLIDNLIEKDIDVDKIMQDIKNILSQKEYELYKDHYIEKKELPHIAKKLNISYTATTTRISRVKRKIIDIVKKHMNNLFFL